MQSKIQKWGNSQGLRFPKHILEEAQINTGDAVDITVELHRIIIKPARKKKYDLREIISRMPKGIAIGEADWGEPTGKEEW